jgi:hypothetical protein
VSAIHILSATEIPEVWQWEVRADGKKERVKTSRAEDAVTIFEQNQGPSTGGVTVRLVDAYRDDDYPEITCHRDDCGTKFKGAGVYCSHKCAVMDA